MLLKKINIGMLTIVILFAVTLVPSTGQAKQKEYLKYDFSNPEEVFKTTISETIVGKGINPATLFQILKLGQLVIVNDQPNNPDIAWLSTAGILIHAPADHVMQVLCDYKNYQKMIPQVDEAYSKHITDAIDHVFYKLTIKLLFFKIKIPYSVYHYSSSPYRIDWVKAGGKFKVNFGAYEVIPLPGHPNHSMLFYTSFAQPRSAILNKLYKRFPSLDKQINLSAGILWVKALGEYAESGYTQKGPAIEPPVKEKTSLPDLIRNHPETLMTLSSRGKVILLENTQPKYTTAGIIINKSSQEAYHSASDFAGSCSLNDRHSMTVLSRGENWARVKVKLAINVVFDFNAEYIVNYQMNPPFHLGWQEEVRKKHIRTAGSWDFIPAGENKALALYRNASDLRRFGFMLRQLLKIDPAFELAIQACQAQIMVSDLKKWAEATPEEKQRLIQKKK